jgi:chromosome segregation ATPase
MKRSFLEELGLEKDVIDKIMNENGKDVEKAKGSLADVQAERDDLKKQISDRDEQLESLKKAKGNSEELQKQIEQLQADNKQIKIDTAVERALAGAKAKNITAVKALLKLDGAELADDGTIKGLAEQIDAVKKDADYLFEADKPAKTKPSVKGATPGEGNDDKPTGITAEQFRKMGYKERMELFNNDKETYDALIGASKE